jgi:hypothetical protein
MVWPFLLLMCMLVIFTLGGEATQLTPTSGFVFTKELTGMRM